MVASAVALPETGKLCRASAGKIARQPIRQYYGTMFGDRFEQATILRTGPDGLTRVIVRRSWSERESILVEASEAEVSCLVDGRCSTKGRLGFRRIGAMHLARIAAWWTYRDDIRQSGSCRRAGSHADGQRRFVHRIVTIPLD